MDSKDCSSIGLLNMFTHPVFQVKDEIIVAANQSAQALQIPENRSVFEIIRSGQDAYRDFVEGCLSITVGVGPVNFIASVVRVDSIDFFHLQSGNEANDLQALALASQHLRDPLSNVIALTDSLCNADENSMDKVRSLRVSKLNQNLHRLLRSVGNMSDAYSCADKINNMETLNISAVLREAVEKTMQHQYLDKPRFEFMDQSSDLIGTADRDLLERAALNLLSNALRYSDPQSTIKVSIRNEKNRAIFTVENDCMDLTPETLSTIFFQYRRTPSIFDGGKGLGLGLSIVQAAASAHKGSVLVTMPKKNTLRFCLTIPVSQNKNCNLSSPLIRPDYTGGFDRSLIELSDVLPSEAYKN